MERTMMRFMLLLFVTLLCGTGRLAAQQTVEARGVTSEVKMEEVTFGHLLELNGKFKLRATPPNSRLHQEATSEYITTSVPEFDILFPASSRSLREARRRSIKLVSTIMRQGISHIRLRTRQTCRFAYWS
jgi:hypothetical protein